MSEPEVTPPALKLPFQPDDYLCTWHLPGPDGAVVEAPGLVTLSSDHPPRGSAHGKVPIESTGGMTSFPQEVDLPLLTAHLANGATAVITEARITYWFPERASITGAAAIVTAGTLISSSSSSYECVELQVEHLERSRIESCGVVGFEV